MGEKRVSGLKRAGQQYKSRRLDFEKSNRTVLTIFNGVMTIWRTVPLSQMSAVFPERADLVPVLGGTSLFKRHS